MLPRLMKVLSIVSGRWPYVPPSSAGDSRFTVLRAASCHRAWSAGWVGDGLHAAGRHANLVRFIGAVVLAGVKGGEQPAWRWKVAWRNAA